MLQLAVLEDHNSLETMIDIIVKKVRKQDQKTFCIGQDFFSLLLRGSKETLESHISKTTRTKTQDPLIAKYMAYQACLYTKICWLRKIPVEIDHSFSTDVINANKTNKTL